jgi:hypothetical protein
MKKITFVIGFTIYSQIKERTNTAAFQRKGRTNPATPPPTMTMIKVMNTTRILVNRPLLDIALQEFGRVVIMKKTIPIIAPIIILIRKVTQKRKKPLMFLDS